MRRRWAASECYPDSGRKVGSQDVAVEIADRERNRDMSAAIKILDRLHNVKKLRVGNWVAGCPCCQSKRGRPISVRELDDGRLLIHPFCGCETESVLGALGLALSDLFDRAIDQHLGPSHSRVPARDILEAIDTEVTTVVMVLDDILAQRKVNPEQIERLTQAAAAIGRARSQLHGR
jgi:hypothetical protein